MGLFDYIDKAMNTQRQIEADEAREKIKLQKLVDQYKADISAQASAQKAQMMQQANAVYVSGNTPTTGQYVTAGIRTGTLNNNVNTIYGNGGVSVGNWTISSTTTAVMPAYWTFPVNAATGNKYDIEFLDAKGQKVILSVDAAFLDMINHINEEHRRVINSLPKSLPDPDFDLDEMAAAEELLESMNGARQEAV